MRAFYAAVCFAALLSGCGGPAGRYYHYDTALVLASRGEFDAARSSFERSRDKGEMVEDPVMLDMCVTLLDAVADSSYQSSNARDIFTGLRYLTEGEYVLASHSIYLADRRESTLLSSVLLGYSFLEWAIAEASGTFLPPEYAIPTELIGDAGYPDTKTLTQSAIHTLESASRDYAESPLPYYVLAPTYVLAGDLRKAEQACAEAERAGLPCSEAITELAEDTRALSN